ncbi:hypothetical protein UC34_22375 [Pandoraea vervacti]|uniref:Uncharacterized protein n=1 Tax=Pandoraea vervacti TaxID=656178 RepID=A0ABN4G100_9BURK|nr:hypothetical protein [Pandoraea vervacti]AJP58943.1 hypothetical protein UC34_22375 [Pandoraea vervacti]
MLMTADELDLVAFRCDGLQSIAHLYEELNVLRPNFDPIEMKNLFLWCVRELMRRGRLKFLGEGWVRDGVGPDAPLMFEDQPFEPHDLVKNGLRQPVDPSPEGVMRLIESKWPSQVRPAFNVKERGFDPLWFEKWYFVWEGEVDENRA